MHIEGLDELDQKILGLIEEDARMSYSEIGDAVGISRVAVKNRIRAMEDKGIIAGYKTVINSMAAKNGIHFFVEIITEANQFQAVSERMAQNPIIQKVYALTGESRILAEGFASCTQRYETYMKELRNHTDGMRSLVVQHVQYVIKDDDGAGLRKEVVSDDGGKVLF